MIKRLIICSDTHGYHKGIENMPEGDIFIHCGDNTIYGETWEMDNFLNWLGTLKFKNIVFINGNHEVVVGKTKGLTKKMVDNYNKYHFTKIHYLENESVEIGGLKFYGSPMTPEFFDWQYMYSRNGEGKDIWAKIPEDTDILISHGPPETVLDSVKPWGHYYSPFAGCPHLLERVSVVKPILHCFGHIHGSRSHRRLANPKFNETLFVNSSICDESYKPVNKPYVIDIIDGKAEVIDC